ncbi:PC-esterase domain-containing protein 1A [Chionoecetes opilio]|uniref:PC-esterase domain-containing protein 1A n=1 Tax=Chionoecetes opilio TaxID=41210 RepID=A0A8J4YNN5_CHIOP|nr:PC-esterase domain-containing protein 1A [Chionoecetes opilio]
MADVFSKHDARDLLSNKFVLLIGDSNMRALYKDLLCLLHDGGIIPEKMLRRGSERAPQFGDEILEKAATKVGRGYFEVRESKKKDLWVRYIFVTQAIAPSLMKELDRLEDNRLPPPDIIVLNSCLWDITRWGPEQEDKYKQNLATLFHRFRRLLPPSALVVWTASLPVATERVKGGVFIQQIEFMKHSMRFMLLEANLFTHNLCRVFGFNFLDLHYYMQYQLNRRTNDGLHWEPPAVRYITNILLTHFGLSPATLLVPLTATLLVPLTATLLVSLTATLVPLTATLLVPLTATLLVPLTATLGAPHWPLLVPLTATLLVPLTAISWCPSLPLLVPLTATLLVPSLPLLVPSLPLLVLLTATS